MQECQGLIAEAEKKKSQFLETKSLANGLRVSCEKKDAVYIKNQIVSLEAKLNKFITRSHEREKQLESAYQEVRAWEEGVSSLDSWMEETQRRLSSSPPTTSDVDRLKQAFQQAKGLLEEVNEKRVPYEMTRRRGISLTEKAAKSERKHIEAKNDLLKKRWEETIGRAEQRCGAAEKAVVEGGKFSEAISSCEGWLDAQLERLASGRRVRGDSDCVRELIHEEKRHEEARRKKKATLDALQQKASKLLEEGVDDSLEVEAAAANITEKWKQLQKASSERAAALEEAQKEADEVDAKVHAILDFLQTTESKLKVPPSGDISASLEAVSALRAVLFEEKPSMDDVRQRVSDILADCHPSAEPSFRNTLRVIETKWAEVEKRAADKEEELRKEDEKEKERNAELNALKDFIDEKRVELDKMMAVEMAPDVETIESRQEELEKLEFELREKQPVVDDLTKRSDKDEKQPRRRNFQKEKELGDRWRSMWTDALSHKSDLEKQKAYQAEVNRLRHWKWDDWKDRYVEFNDHAKARVNDLFRRQTRSSNGSVPRESFINAVISTKFPTSRLEMDKVADLFDKNGMINATEFVNALKFGSNKNRAPANPPSEEEQKTIIKQEMNKRRDMCCCPHRFKIEYEGEPPGLAFQKRAVPRDGGVVQTYRFGDNQIKRMVRILHTTVMVRVGGGWEPLDEFLEKHDPCRSKNRTNKEIYSPYYNDVRPLHATDQMYAFTKNRHAREYAPPAGDEVSLLKPFDAHGIQGPVSKLREKTDVRSVPMFGENRFETQKASASDFTLLEELSRPESRVSEMSESERPSRIPSLRSKKGQKYNPPSASNKK